MAGKQVNFEVDVNANKAQQGLKEFSRAVKQANKEAEDSFDDTSTAAERAAKTIADMAHKMDSEMRDAASAADVLSDALGPELTGRMDVDQVVADLNKMGLTFDEIRADADKLASALKEVDGVRLQQVNDGLSTTSSRMGGVNDEARRAAGGVDEISDSGRGANSALANMIGNSAQDLGTLGGVAGSAGVAIGQMAEYAADATLAGEALSASLLSMAAVAGPIVALSVATALIPKAFAAFKGEDTAAQVKAITDALTEQLGTLDDYQSMVQSAFGEGTADIIDVFTESMFKALDASQADDFVAGLESALGRLGTLRSQFGEVLGKTTQEQSAWIDSLLELQGVAPDTAAAVADFYAGVTAFPTAAVDAWITSNPELADGLLQVSTALGEVRKNNSASIQSFLNQQRAINANTRAIVDQAIALSANGKGQLDWNDALKEFIRLSQDVGPAFGTTLEQAQGMLDAMADPVSKLSGSFTTFDGRLVDLGAEWGALVDDVRDGTLDMEGADTVIADLGAAAGLGADDLLALAKAQGEGVKTAENLQRAEVEVAGAIGKTADNAFDLADALQAATDKALGLIDTRHGLADAQQSWDDALEALPALLDASTQAMDDATEGSAEWIAARNDARDVAETDIDLLVEARKQQALANGEQLDAADITRTYAEGLARVGSTLDHRVIPSVVDYYSQILKIPDDKQTEFEMILATGDQDAIEKFIADNTGTKKTTVNVIAVGVAQARSDIAGAATPRSTTISVGANTSSADATMSAWRKGQSNTPVTVPVKAGAIVGRSSSGNKVGGRQTADPTVATAATAPAATVRAPAAVTAQAAPAPFVANVTINTGVMGNHFDVERSVARALRRVSRINGRRAVTG